MRYCTRCIMPDTRPGLVIGDDGVCNACRNYESRADIDWAARVAAFEQVAVHARSSTREYDCIIPVSGGKDSFWQVVTCLEYGLKPLCVTWLPPSRTEIGRRNLENLIALGVDHIGYRINPEVEKRFVLKAYERLGSTAIPMHQAIFSIPLRLAVRLGIPLVVWGENSAFEYGGRDDIAKGFRLDRAWLAAHGVTGGTTAMDWVGEGLDEKAMSPYLLPSEKELTHANVHAVFLGYYFPWDPRKSLAVASAHGFQAAEGCPRTGLYDFADIDDDFISIHHWLKWYKFGFTRLFDNLSLEIRSGRVTRDEAVAIVRQAGEQRPSKDIASFCAYHGVAVQWFMDVAERFRNRAIWSREDGVWRIQGFLLPDWSW